MKRLLLALAGALAVAAREHGERHRRDLELAELRATARAAIGNGDVVLRQVLDIEPPVGGIERIAQAYDRHDEARRRVAGG